MGNFDLHCRSQKCETFRTYVIILLAKQFCKYVEYGSFEHLLFLLTVTNDDYTMIMTLKVQADLYLKSCNHEAFLDVDI